MKHLYPTFLLLFFGGTAVGQAVNDECIDAIALPDQLEYCSGAEGANNIDATASLDPVSGYDICVSETDEIRDVWYSFVAQTNAARITVAGRIPTAIRGSLRTPQLSVYAGGCNGLTRADAIACRSPFETINSVNTIATNLTPGETYYIMVGGRNGREGTFELCVRQFESPPAPSADCQTGVILCDKSPFSINQIQGNGSVEDDLGYETTSSCSATEDNSAWYKWTCDQSGTLTFTLTPLGAAPNEDIDFAVYEFTNGIDDCGSRITLRSMYSGETTNQADELNLPCLGPTGLSLTDTDQTEDCGCQAGNNNFVAAIDMVAGRSYGIVILNFSASGEGVEIEFGGTGTFLGPEPEFSFSEDEVCVGESLTFQDLSTSVDAIVSWEWDFGATAVPASASGPGPHDVVFGEAGSPDVELIITTSRECREILSRREVTVVCCDGQFAGSGTATDVICPNDSTGTIQFSATSSFSPTTLTYAWSNGATTANLTDLSQGTYVVTVTDASACRDSFELTVGGPEPFTFDTAIVRPSCAGGVDGSLTFTVLGGGAGPYTYSFGGGPFGNGNTVTDLPISTVNVRARDANDCPIEQNIFVDELRLGLVQGVNVFTEPICAGEANGSITIQLANGQPTYTYDFGLGDGPQPNATQTDLAAGQYTVTAEDADGCRGIFPVTITDPPAITMVSDGLGSTCFGTDDGRIVLLYGGGRPGYTIDWNDGSTADTVRNDLPPGNYVATLTDQNGCQRSVTTVLTEPDEIFPALEVTTNLVCFEEPTGSFMMSATGGTPGYTFAVAGGPFQAEPLLGGLAAGNYLLYVQDANGCLDSLTASLTEPGEFIIDPGPGSRIYLGFDTTMLAVANYDPVTFNWGPDTLDCLTPDCSLVRAAPRVTTDYEVIGINAAGCRDTVGVKLQVIQDLPVYIPSAFSPNGDGVNDGFTVFGGPAVAGIDVLRIYHRWGGLIYEGLDFDAGDPAQGWNGEAENGRTLNPGVFVYQAFVRFLDDTVIEFTGEVTLLR